MKAHCTKCNSIYDNYKNDYLKCFSCNQEESKKMIKHINSAKIPQTDCTKHITLDQKKQIAAFILETHGDLYKSYREAPKFILEKLGIAVNFIGVRSIVNSSYFKEMAFKDCD